MYEVRLKTLDPATGFKIPDGLSQVRLRGLSVIHDGFGWRMMEARQTFFMTVNNGGAAPWPNRENYWSEQLAFMQFPWWVLQGGWQACIAW